MIDPTVLVAIVGFLGLVATAVGGYLAGRNKTIVEAYEDLVADLRREIDRLKAEVAELRLLLSSRPRSRRSDKS